VVANPKFDIDFDRGMVGEESYKHFLLGKHEVKTDYRAAETGNFYVEVRQYNKNMEWASGISTTEADFWVQASPRGLGGIYIKTEAMKDLVIQASERFTRQPIYNDSTNASIGVLVRVNDVLNCLGFR
jgi:hypothetical protein